VLVVAIIAVVVYLWYTIRRKGTKPKSTASDRALETTWTAPLVEKPSNASGPTQVDDKTKL
jgi:hypothetical protein